jgi:hypothetical protein
VAVPNFQTVLHRLTKNPILRKIRTCRFFLIGSFHFSRALCMARSDSGTKTTRKIDDNTNQQQQADPAAADHWAAKIKAAAAEQE